MVFDLFGYNLVQIKNDSIEHGDFLNEQLNSCRNSETVIFFDIDAIPINKNEFEKLLEHSNDNTIVGAAQSANHFNNGNNLYIGPFFMVIPSNLYMKLGSPNMCDNFEGQLDVGQNLTVVAESFPDVVFHYLYPTHVEIPKWKLYPNSEFGIGTTYENSVYHAFEIRNSQSNIRFIRKCKEVIYLNRNINYRRYLRIQIEIFIFKVFNRLKIK
jgi:hypothetical protein